MFMPSRAACLAVLGGVVLTGAMQRQNLNTPEWREELARGFAPYRQLVLGDFPIDDRVTSPHRMMTQGFIHYSFRSQWSSSNGFARADVTSFSVRSGFDRNKSWRRSTVAVDSPLIVHEQGHLDINETHAAKVERMRLPDGNGFTGDDASNDLREKLKSLFDRILRESHDEQAKYDVETRHGADAERQTYWTGQLQKRLRELKIIR